MVVKMQFVLLCSCLPSLWKTLPPLNFTETQTWTVEQIVVFTTVDHESVIVL